MFLAGSRSFPGVRIFLLTFLYLLLSFLSSHFFGGFYFFLVASFVYVFILLFSEPF